MMSPSGANRLRGDVCKALRALDSGVASMGLAIKSPEQSEP